MEESGMIELADGINVEVQLRGDQVREVSGSALEKVSSSIKDINPLILKVCGPLKSLWSELGRDMHVESIEVEFGVSFQIGGQIFIAQAAGGANLKVAISLTQNTALSEKQSPSVEPAG
jgi:hypothetical protein